MYEHGKGKNPSNQSNGSFTTNSYITTGSSPRIKRVVVTVYEYDTEGRVTKETVTETEYDGSYQPYIYPSPYQPYSPTWYSSTTTDPGPTATN